MTRAAASDDHSIAIVPFELCHHADVIALVTAIQTTELGIPITLADQPDLQDIVGYFRRGVGELWVALDGDEVVGTIALVDGGESTCSLRKMFVRKDRRGRPWGIARALLARLVEHAEARGFAAIYLGTTLVMTHAHGFYERHGFVEIGLDEMPKTASYSHVDQKFYKRALTGAGARGVE